MRVFFFVFDMDVSFTLSSIRLPKLATAAASAVKADMTLIPGNRSCGARFGSTRAIELLQDLCAHCSVPQIRFLSSAQLHY